MNIVPYTEMEHTTTFKLSLIATKARDDRKLKFTSLAHLLNADYLRMCFGELAPKRSPGIDARTTESYSDEEITSAIATVVAKMKRHAYRPQPVRRVFIPKANGKLRPLGIPTTLDKVVQLALTRILEPLFEPLFLDLSYGFRPNRSAHQALAAINHMVMGQRVNWVIDADIKGFFDNVNHEKMLQCLRQRVTDPSMLEILSRFLKAGVMTEGSVQATTRGTPQGGIISPLLANIYLHYCLDLWFTLREKRKLKGYAQLVRYADDFVICCQYQHEAHIILNDLKARLAEFGLECAEDKTRVIEFGRFAASHHRRTAAIRPATFDFLGFTHYCGTTRNGRFALKLRTSRKKYAANAKALTQWIKSVRNELPLVVIWGKLALKLKGHYNYYGVSGNFVRINAYYQHARFAAFKWMNCRSQKKTWDWQSYEAYLRQYPLPRPKLTYAIYNTW